MSEYPSFKEVLDRVTEANHAQYATKRNDSNYAEVQEEKQRAQAGYLAVLIREGRLTVDSTNVVKAADQGFNILDPEELKAWGEALYRYSINETEMVMGGREYGSLDSVDATKAYELLDAQTEPIQDVSIFLSENGLKAIEDYELEPDFGRPGAYVKENVCYVFSDGSVADEDFENIFVNMSEYHEHQINLAEDAWEQRTADFHAGDAPGFVQPKSAEQLHREHEAAKGRIDGIDF